MQDKIEYIGKNTLIQHGRLNNRVYLMKMDETDFPGIIADINHIAIENNYSKIFCKVPSWAAPFFISKGFFTEAVVPLFYKGTTDAFFMSKILNSDRFRMLEYGKLKLLSEMLYSINEKNNRQLPNNKNFIIKELIANNIEEISSLFKTVFKSYPFPIYSTEYLNKIINENVRFFGAFYKEKLVAVSSAEMDKENLNAEMTDFATLPEYRGNKLSIFLLKDMENSMIKIGMKTVFTIARLNSIPMNKTFLNNGYKYGGTLIKNTNISGSIESMNVLYKHL